MKKLSTVAFVLVLSSFVIADVESIEGLKGLREVAVVVDAFTPEQIQHGLNPLDLAERIAKTLEEYKVKPISADELSESPDTPALWLLVTTSFLDNVVLVSFELSLRDDVVLVRDKKVTVTKAITWSKQSIGAMSKGALKTGIEMKLTDFLRAFIEDHHEANGLDNPFKGKKGDVSA